MLLFLDLVFSGTEGFEYKSSSTTEYGETYKNHTIKVGKSIFVVKKKTAKKIRDFMSELYLYLFGIAVLGLLSIITIGLTRNIFMEDELERALFCNGFIYFFLSMTTVNGIDYRMFFFIPALIFDVLLLGAKLVKFIKLNYNKTRFSKHLNIFKLSIFEKIKNKRLKKKIIRAFEETL